MVFVKFYIKFNISCKYVCKYFKAIKCSLRSAHYQLTTGWHVTMRRHKRYVFIVDSQSAQKSKPNMNGSVRWACKRCHTPVVSAVGLQICVSEGLCSWMWRLYAAGQILISAISIHYCRFMVIAWLRWWCHRSKIGCSEPLAAIIRRRKQVFIKCRVISIRKYLHQSVTLEYW